MPGDIMNKPRIYLAGKILGDSTAEIFDHAQSDWRTKSLADWRNQILGFPLPVRNTGENFLMQECKDFYFTGPFPVIGEDHDLLGGPEWDGIPARSLEAIRKSDIVFAWIDSPTTFGTLIELGFAKALNKFIWIAGPKYFHDFWFAYAIADNAEDALDAIFEASDFHHQEGKPTKAWFNSPKEAFDCFWKEWIKRGGI